MPDYTHCSILLHLVWNDIRETLGGDSFKEGLSTKHAPTRVTHCSSGQRKENNLTGLAIRRSFSFIVSFCNTDSTKNRLFRYSCIMVHAFCAHSKTVNDLWFVLWRIRPLFPEDGHCFFSSLGGSSRDIVVVHASGRGNCLKTLPRIRLECGK